MKNVNKLSEELNQGRKEIKTDSYSMSIGEIMNLYKDGELELAPAYQRLFRWDDDHKSKFIESILLGIPLPPIFVAQKEGGKWSIVDGLQRVSTILQLTGELSGKPPLVLKTTKKLPSLENFTWATLPEEIKRTLKRSKFDVNIILTENSIQAQYELFQRLNTGGLHLEPQEIRNCLIIMLDEPFYNRLNELKEYPSFKKSLKIQDGKFDIEYHMELILRYFICKHNKVEFSQYKASSTLLADFLDDQTIALMEDREFDMVKETDIFKRTFDFLYKILGDKAFKKYNPKKDDFDGAFLNTSYEAITTGVALNIDKYEKMAKADFLKKVKAMYSAKDFIEYSKRGNKALYRISGLMAFSKKYFKV